MDNTVYRLYIPVKQNNDGVLEYVLDCNKRIRVFTSIEKLRKSVKDYTFIYCYDKVRVLN